MNHRVLPSLLLTLTVGLAWPASAHAQNCPHRDSWPTVEWPSRVEEYATARAAEIADLEDYIFTLVGKDKDRKGRRTDGLIIVQGGSIVYERYGRGFEATNRHLAWSVSKCFTSALVGVAVEQGELDVSDSLCDHLEPVRPENCDITVQDLLEMASGLDWSEGYEGQNNQESSVIQMLYGDGYQNMVDFVLGHPTRDPPGTTYQYSTGETTVLAAVVTGAMRPDYGELYPWDFLFDPIGMDSAVFERDMAGNFAGGMYVFATPRDFARFGWLYLNDGCWEDVRILPEGWVHDSTQVTDPFRMEPLHVGEDVEGWEWWINKPVPEQGIEKPWEGTPDDAFAALGHWGQSITVIPSLDMVIVRTADDREEDVLDRDVFYPLAIAVGREL